MIGLLLYEALTLPWLPAVALLYAWVLGLSVAAMWMEVAT